MNYFFEGYVPGEKVKKEKKDKKFQLWIIRG